MDRLYKRSFIYTMKKNLQEDVRFVMAQFRIGNFLLNTPMFLDKKDSRMHTIYHVTFISVWIGLILIMSYMAVHKFWISKHQQIIHDFTSMSLEIMILASEIFNILVCVTSQQEMNSWRLFFNDVARVDDILGEYERLSDFSWKFQYIKLVSFSLLFVGVYSNDIHLWITLSQYQIEYNSMFYTFLYYFQIYDGMLIINSTNMLRSRYNRFEKLLINIGKQKMNPSLVLSKWARISENLDSQKAMGLYKLMYHAVQEFNNIYGWRFFSIFVCWTLQLLKNIYFLLFIGTKIEFHYGEAMLSNISYPLLFLVFTVMILMACEKLEKSGDRLTTTCYILISELEKSPFREDLIELADLTCRLTPKIIAAGCYEVNQSLLSTLFSAFVTYLIICIQFNNSALTSIT